MVPVIGRFEVSAAPRIGIFSIPLVGRTFAPLSY